jgi:hypothetical protein
MMLVSSSPCTGRLSSIGVGHVLVSRRILVRAEGAGVDGGGAARHGSELLPGNETPSAAGNLVRIDQPPAAWS